MSETLEQVEKKETVDTTAEVIVIDRVQSAIQNAERSFAELVKDSNIDKRAKELKAQLKKITINGVEDKDNYKKVKEISKESSKLRIAIEARRKEQKADYITVGKKIDELASSYQLLINPVENDADKKLEEIDNLKKEAEEKAAREKEELKQSRIAELVENGCPFTGSWWQINDISLGVQQIEESTIEQWEQMIAKVKAENAKNIEAKRVKEEQEAEEKRKQDAIKEENDRLAAQLKKQQDDLAEQQRKFAEQQAEFDRKKKESDELAEKQEKAQKEVEERWQLAINAKPFEDLGYKYEFNEQVWLLTIGNNRHKIDKSAMLRGGEELLVDAKSKIEEFTTLKKAQEEKQRLAELLKERELEVIALQFNVNESGLWECPDIDFKFANTLSDYTTDEWESYIKDVKDFWAAKAEERRVAKQTDLENFNEWVLRLKQVTPPIFKDESLNQEARNIVALFVTK